LEYVASYEIVVKRGPGDRTGCLRAPSSVFDDQRKRDLRTLDRRERDKQSMIT
jgi:hypothetical protein